MFYYRTTEPEIVAAVAAYFEKRQAIAKAGHEFAQRFGAKEALFGTIRFELAGIVFDKTKPPANPELWTKPSRQHMQRPRVGGGTAGRALRNEWEMNWPKAFVTTAEWCTAAGLGNAGWGRPGVALVDEHKTVYFCNDSPAKPQAGVHEITATEYIAATGDK